MTHTSLKSLFSGIADAIRLKEGSTDAIVADDFPDRIASIQMGDTAVEDALLTGNGLTEYTNDRVETVNAHAFSSPYLREIGTKMTLKKVHLGNATYIGMSAFTECEFLEEAIIPKATTIGQKAFAFCTSLRKADFRHAFVGYGAFDMCSKLERVDVECITHNGNIFTGCTSLTTLVIRGVYIFVAHEADDFLVGTPFEKGLGYIYVPREKIEEYKIKNGWSTYASQFRALEDYTVDGTITGDLDETKI